MNEITLTLEGDRTAYRPGEAVSGTFSWSLDEAPESLSVRLLWFTQGKGTVDVGVVDERPMAAAEPFGQQGFRFRVPEGPYSFSGRLISLLWAVEAVATDPDAVTRVNLVVSPTLVEVLVGPPPGMSGS